jgi:hypothetical protein
MYQQSWILHNGGVALTLKCSGERKSQGCTTVEPIVILRRNGSHPGERLDQAGGAALDATEGAPA